MERTRRRNYIALTIGWIVAVLAVLLENDRGRPEAYWLLGAMSGITMTYVEIRIRNRKNHEVIG